MGLKVASWLLVMGLCISGLSGLVFKPQIAEASTANPSIISPITNLTGSPADWLSVWSYRKKITIDYTKVDSGLTDFPVAVILTSSNFDFSKARSDGYDIRFTQSDGTTLLKYEREQHDSTGQKAVYWVKVPSVSSSTNTEFYIYYGKSDASDGADPTNVWDSSFKGVWHLKEDPSGTAPQMNDTTINAKHGTVSGTGATSDTGKIGNAIRLAGDKNYVDTSSDVMGDTTELTIEAWINGDVFDRELIGKAWYVAEGEWGNSTGNNVINFTTWTTSGRKDLAGSTTPSTGQWYYVACRYDGSYQKIFLDDAEDGSLAQTGTLPATNKTFKIGAGGRAAVEETSTSHDGLIDEVRVSNVARSAAWIKASYYSGNNTLLSIGSEEAATGLVAHLRFNENSGSVAYDETTNNNDGTIYGATWVKGMTISGAAGTAPSFDGIDDYIYKDVGVSGIGGTNQMTLEAWIKRGSAGGSHSILAVGDCDAYQFIRFALSNDALQPIFGNDANNDWRYLTTTNTLTDTANWHHVAATYNAGTIKVYVDGVEWTGTYTGSWTGIVVSPTVYLRIGNFFYHGNIAPFHGIIDEVKIYNEARTAAEILTDYQAGTPPEEENVNQAPTASFTYSPSTPTTSDTVQFTDNSADSDGTIASWSWDFGDNATSTSQNPTHQYDNVGTYTATLTVTDDDNATNSTSKSVTVIPPEEEKPPTSLSVSPSSFIENSGESRTLTATLKDNNNNTLVGKTIFWSATSGTISPSSGTTDSFGQVSVTYIAPTVTAQTLVTVTASFAGDASYLSSSGASLEIIIKPEEGTIFTTLTISPENFIENSGESRTLTATLKDNANNALANKTIIWSATAGSLLTTSGTTNGSGQVSVTYTAPTVTAQTLVTVTASFAGDASYLSSSGYSYGTIALVKNVPTTLSISPSSFTLHPSGSRTLTATLKDNANNPIANKTVTWGMTVGALSATGGTTDSSGRVSVTYTAPSYETTVAVTASFAGDAPYLASNGVSSGTIAKASTTLTVNPSAFTLQPGIATTLTAMLTSDGAPLIGKTLSWGATSGGVAPSSETTGSLGQVTATYTAPSYEDNAVVTVTFAGDGQYQASSGSSSGKIESTPPLQADVEIKPDTLQIGSTGEWVTCYIELPDNNVSQIDITSILLEGTVQVDSAASTEIGDHDTDGVSDLMVKFDRASVENIVVPGPTSLTVTGSVGESTFTGTDKIDVIKTGPGALASARSEARGEIPEVREEVYNPDLEVTAQAGDNKVTVSVSSVVSTGTTIVVNVDHTVVPISSMEELEVLFDNEKIELANDYDDVLDTTDEDEPEYLVLLGAEGIQVLISIPSFSVHTVTIGKVVEAAPTPTLPTQPFVAAPPMWVIVIAAIALVAILIAVIWRYLSAGTKGVEKVLKPRKIRPQKLSPAQIESMVYNYIKRHRGELDVRRCAKKLGLSEREVGMAVEVLKAKGKVAEE